MKKIDANISFNLKDFNNDKSSVLSFLRRLKRLKLFNRTEEIDNFFSQQPSYAYKYVKHLLASSKFNFEKREAEYFDTEKNRLSSENEKIFKKNIKFAIAYLKITNQTKFRDSKLQSYFEKKIYEEAGLAYDYASIVLKGRIPEEKETIFLENYFVLYHYSRNILKGKFSDNIHKKIVLETFNDENKNRFHYSLLTSYLAQDFSKGREDYSYHRYI